MTDKDLMILEQLTYLDKDILMAAGLNRSENYFFKRSAKAKTLSEILSIFTEERLRQLELHSDGIGLGGANGPGWASIIRRIKNSNLKDLKLTKVMQDNENNNIAYCYEQQDGKAIVTFRGTMGPIEWEDNAKGFDIPDTEKQKEALEFIESLKYDDITVVGHSKGGNKAMYTTMLCDKVTHCVAMDAQGFSPEFIDKYYGEINKRAKLVTNYSKTADFVHVLMFQIPGSKQVYCRGYQNGTGIKNGEYYHGSSTFFRTRTNGTLILGEDDQVIIDTTVEDEEAKMLHGLTTFILNNGSAEDKRYFSKYVGKLLREIVGEKKSPEEVVLSDLEGTSLVLAYTVKYMKEMNIDKEKIKKIINKYFPSLSDGLNGGISKGIDLLIEQLSDNDNDFFITNVVPFITKREFGIEIDERFIKIWKMTDKKVREIECKKGTGEHPLRKTFTRDFSSKTYTELMDVLNCISKINFSVSNWSRNANEKWYGAIMTDFAIRIISKYFSTLDEANFTSRIRIDNIFDNISNIDRKFAQVMASERRNIEILKNNISAVL